MNPVKIQSIVAMIQSQIQESINILNLLSTRRWAVVGLNIL